MNTNTHPALRLGVNIDHVATLRNARGGVHPDPVRAAVEVERAGADGLTIHLREDRRHIRDDDVRHLVEISRLPINLELAATAEMQKIALEALPHAVCIVPEKREEVTTEGGLDAKGQEADLTAFVAPLAKAGIRVSLFIDPELDQLEAAKRIGAGAIEYHTGAYADAVSDEQRRGEYQRLVTAAAATVGTGIECHAGHGLNYDNVVAIAQIPEIIELNIGHFLMGEALFVGLVPAIARMRAMMEEARSQGAVPPALVE
ncbi:MAG: pyridoxine 5'-phosphate synthase [Pseudomonadota bacterium]